MVQFSFNSIISVLQYQIFCHSHIQAIKKWLRMNALSLGVYCGFNVLFELEVNRPPTLNTWTHCRFSLQLSSLPRQVGHIFCSSYHLKHETENMPFYIQRKRALGFHARQSSFSRSRRDSGLTTHILNICRGSGGAVLDIVCMWHQTANGKGLMIRPYVTSKHAHTHFHTKGTWYLASKIWKNTALLANKSSNTARINRPDLWECESACRELRAYLCGSVGVEWSCASFFMEHYSSLMWWWIAGPQASKWPIIWSLN